MTTHKEKRWKLKNNRQSFGYIRDMKIVSDPDGRAVAHVFDVKGDDLKLMVAAPEMYEALVEAIGILDDIAFDDGDPVLDYVCGLARTALAKAEGRERE